MQSRGLLAVRCRPPNGLNRIYGAIGLAFWRYTNSRFDARLSETRWDGDISYPHSTRYCGTSSRFFPPTSSTYGIRRTGLNSLTGSSEPPKCNACWPARKPPGLPGECKPLSDFTVTDDFRMPVRTACKWSEIRGKFSKILVTDSGKRLMFRTRPAGAPFERTSHCVGATRHGCLVR